MTQQTQDRVMQAVRRAKEGLEPPLFYAEMVEQKGYDPLAPFGPRGVITTKRQRHRAGQLTRKVWDSLGPDGNVLPGKAVPVSAVNTNELPIVVPSGESGDDATATE